MRFVVILLLLMAAHFSLTPFAPAPAGRAWAGWPFAVDSQPLFALVGGLPQAGGSIITPLLAGIAGLGFLAALGAYVGWGLPARWWSSLVLGAAVASILLYSLYFGRWALLPITLDVVLIWGVLAQHWTVMRLSGS